MHRRRALVVGDRIRERTQFVALRRATALVIDSIEYTIAETYYHFQKPDPFDAQLWESIKCQVMRVALRAKLDADPALRALLRATKGHPLLAVKSDTYWGVDAINGGRNRLAELWMELRDEIESGGR